MLRFIFSVAAVSALLPFPFTLTTAQTIRASYSNLPDSRSIEPKNFLPDTTIVEVLMPKLAIKKSGILLSRLPEKDREKWKILEHIIRLRSQSGIPLHPTLWKLWHWAENSDHQIFVEFHNNKNIQTSIAGSFHIESLDPTGKQHIAVIRLHLTSIEQALVSEVKANEMRFIPFYGLRKEERYLEVLGHELAHLQFVLSNFMRAQMVQELVTKTNDQLLLNIQLKVELATAPLFLQRLVQRDTLLKELEAQAVAVEEQIWRELISSKKERPALQLARTLIRNNS